MNQVQKGVSGDLGSVVVIEENQCQGKSPKED